MEEGKILFFRCGKDNFDLWNVIFQITVIQDGRQVSNLSVNFEPSCASMNGDHPDIAVGGSSDHKVCI